MEKENLCARAMGPKQPKSTVLSLEEEGKLYLFVAIDLTSKFVHVELLEKYGKMEAAQFLRNLIKVVPYKINTILTDNGIQFTNRKVDLFAWMHIFDRVCYENEIEHRLLKLNIPGQMARLNA